MKTKFEVQYEASSFEPTAIEKLVKEDLKAMGVKFVSLETLNIYYKPAESAVYYVTVAKDGTVYRSEALEVKANEE